MGKPRPNPDHPRDPWSQHQGGDQRRTPEENRSQSQHSKDHRKDRRTDNKGPSKPDQGKPLPPGHPDWRRETSDRNESSGSSQASGHNSSTNASRMGPPSTSQVHSAGGKRILSNSSSMENLPTKRMAIPVSANRVDGATYASKGAAHDPQPPTWKEHDLRVFRSNYAQLTIGRSEFDELAKKLTRHTFNKLKEDPAQRMQARAHKQYYKPELQSGVIECTSSESMGWYKLAIQTISEGAYRAWSKDEAANAFIKIFVPLAYYDFTSEDYLESCQFFYPTFPANCWEVRKDYKQKRKPGERGQPTRVLIVEVTTKGLQFLQRNSYSSSSGVYKLPGTLADMKFVMARLADLTQPKTKDNEAEMDSVEAPETVAIHDMEQDFPPLHTDTSKEDNSSEAPIVDATGDNTGLNSPLIRSDKDPMLGGYITTNEETDDDHLLDSDNPLSPAQRRDWGESEEEESNPRYQT